MDFDDRLRNQLHSQSSDLQLPAEGSNAVRARSRRRKRQRTGGAALATLVVALLAGGWIAGRDTTAEANLATKGLPVSQDASNSTKGNSTPSSSSIEVVLPDPGDPLVLTTAQNVDAPGGYNVYQNGHSGGLYYVLSTAPGVKYDDFEDDLGLIRDDTIYTFDGSSWSQNALADRYISTVESTSEGLLYTVSTGSADSHELALGTSSDAGQVWSWTELDLTSAFGNDPASWPPYAVRFATRGTETFVLAHTSGYLDWEEATKLAITNGATIDPGADEVISVDQNGIGWIQAPEQDVCSVALGNEVGALWAIEPQGPVFDFEGDLTTSQYSSLEEFWRAQELRGPEIYAQALQTVGKIPGCEAFAKCTSEYTARMEELDSRGGNASAELNNETLTWAEESGCIDEVPWLVGTDDPVADASTFVSWQSLGVTPPESWQGISAGFLVDSGEITSLGELFDGEPGFLVDVRSERGQWTASFASTDNNTEIPSTPAYTTWTSTNGNDWTSNTENTFAFEQPAVLANGTSFSPDWGQESTQLLRTAPDGTTKALALSDLSPNVDTEGFQIMNVRTGKYGVLAWAVRSASPGENEFADDSIVLYSPDGIGWGATEVPGAEVIDAIVGEGDVLIFLNDPDLPEGAGQQVVTGQA